MQSIDTMCAKEPSSNLFKDVLNFLIDSIEHNHTAYKSAALDTMHFFKKGKFATKNVAPN